MSNDHCCCPSRDADRCVALRYPEVHRQWLAYLDGDAERPEPCECACHEGDDYNGDEDEPCPTAYHCRTCGLDLAPEDVGACGGRCSGCGGVELEPCRPAGAERRS